MVKAILIKDVPKRSYAAQCMICKCNIVPYVSIQRQLQDGTEYSAICKVHAEIIKEALSD